MSLRFAFLFVIYMLFAIVSSNLSGQCSDLDPLGLNTQPHPSTDQGSGLDPLG
jgi:hypothetical protein